MMKSKTKVAVIYIILSVLFIFSIIPIFYAVVSSFKPVESLFEYAVLTRGRFTLDNYIRLFSASDFPIWLFNSGIVGVVFTLMSVFVCSLGGFAFAKYNFWGKNTVFFMILGTMTLPVWVTIIPLFNWFSKIGFLDTYWALILPGIGLRGAFGIFLMRQYIVGMPSELMDSARLDGCSEFQIYYRIVLPVIKPVLGALGIFNFLYSWNDLIYPLVFIRNPRLFTIPVGLATLLGVFNPQYDLLIAGGMISVVPIMIMFLVLQKQFVAGLTAGAIKG